MKVLFPLAIVLLHATSVSAVAAEAVSSFRFRSDVSAPLDSEAGWAAELNTMAPVAVDRPFRLRMEVTSEESGDLLRFYQLEYRVENGQWKTAVPSDFPYPLYGSPTVSIVEPPYPSGQYTTDLLPHDEEVEHGEDSAGVGFSPVSPIIGETGVATELEWALVVRYFADGPVRLDEGDRIEFRLVRLDGLILEDRARPTLAVTVPADHLGGTFVETPGEIGPWQAPDGQLFFIMEPTETDNRFMMVSSIDGGRSWAEVDGAHRPPARDLEAVDATVKDGAVHMLHQEDVVWYHAFVMTGGPGRMPGWKIRSEPVAAPAKPPVQSVGIAARPDGSLAGFFADGNDIAINVRKAAGEWTETARISAGMRLSGIQVTGRPDGTAILVYSRADGTGIAREFTADNQLGPELVLTDNLATAEADVGSLLRPVILEEPEKTVFVFREKDGRLYERRHDMKENSLSDPVRVSRYAVVQNAVDSDQTAADIVAFGERLIILYVEQESRNLFIVQSSEAGGWSDPELIVEGIEGAWIRAQPLPDGAIGYVYDAGSEGGSGMNRYGTCRPGK